MNTTQDKPITYSFDVSHEFDTQVNLYNCLSLQETEFTSYDYYVKFPQFHGEEIYYLLECATRENADPAEVVRVSQETVDQRNKALLDNFENKLQLGEVLIGLDELSFGTTSDLQDRAVSQQ